MPGTHSPPVIVVGAGFAGCLAALRLHAQGHRVRVIDQGDTCTAIFRAEKLEPEQVEGLRALGQWDAVRECLTEVSEVGSFRGGVVERRRYEDHYSMRYPDLVNALRHRVADRIGIDVHRVTGIESHAGGAKVRLASGEEHAARLCVLATGSATTLARVGLPVASDEQVTSLNLGFDVRLRGSGRCVPEAFNYHSSAPHRDGVHYVTFFPMGELVRVNAFTAWRADDPRIRQLSARPVDTLHELLPRLREFYGEFDCVSKVRSARTRYHQVADATAGIVAIGEAYQSVSPATGMGLTRCLTDVQALARHVASWPGGEPIGEQRIRSFYADPDKVRVDVEARDGWRWFCDSVHGRSLKWRLKRSVIASALRWAMARTRSRGAGAGAAGQQVAS